MNKYVSFIASFFVVATLTGCANQVALSPSSKANIHTVTVNPTIPVPPTIEYAGPHMMGAAVMGGLVGAGIAYACESSTREDILKAMAQRDINLNQIFYQSFIKELHDQTNFKTVRAEPSDAQFKLEILSYGFTDSMQQKRTIPFANVKGILLDSQNKIIWQSTKEVELNSNDYAAQNVQEYIQNQVLMQKAFKALMVQASDDLISTLN